MTILVTGATGNIGGAVIRQLQQRQAPVRGLVRDRQKADHLAAQGVELAVGDLAQPATLDAALQGMEAAFLVLPNVPNQVELECGFIDAAKRAGVKHLVKLSVMGAGELPSTLQQWHRQIEQHLEQSGMSWVHLRPNMFMQNIRWFVPTMNQAGAIYHCLGDTPVSYIDAEDVAAVAAVCLVEPEHKNQSYVLTGKETVRFDEIAALFGQALGRTISYIDVSPADMKAARLAGGEPEWYLDAEAELFACWRQGAGTAITEWVKQLTHREPVTYAEFVEGYVQSHRQDFVHG